MPPPTPQTPIDPLGVSHEHRGAVDHLARVEALREEGRLEEALEESRRALFDDPNNERALEVLTYLGKRTRRWELVESAYERLAERRVEDPTPLVQQARALIMLGRFDEAVSVGQKALERDGANVEGHHVTGRAHLNAGRLSSAIELLEQTIALSPEHGYALNNLGFAYLRANENVKASEVLTRAAELLPTVAYVHNNLGVALERIGDIEGAKQAYDMSTSLSPKYVKARVNADRIARAPSTPNPLIELPGVDQMVDQMIVEEPGVENPGVESMQPPVEPTP